MVLRLHPDEPILDCTRANKAVEQDQENPVDRKYESDVAGFGGRIGMRVEEKRQMHRSLDFALASHSRFAPRSG
jgi:hypothetical protein